MKPNHVDTTEADKAKLEFLEHAPDPYLGLSTEDSDFMRQYEGRAGKRVVRKAGGSVYVGAQPRPACAVGEL